MIIDIAHTFVAQVVPQECLIFQGVSEAFFKHPEKFKQKRASCKEDLLGIGGDEVASLLTPTILTVVKNVVLSPAVSTAFAAPGTENWTTERDSFEKAFLSGSKDHGISLSVSKEQSTLVHELTCQEAARFQIPREQVELLADSIAEKLAMYYGG
jgi:hypothetical protein